MTAEKRGRGRPRIISDEALAEVIKMRKAGVKVATIAAQFGISTDSVYKCYQYKAERATPQAKRVGPRVGPLRLLCPGDWLESPNGTTRIGFVWEIDGDSVEVRSYECSGSPTIKHMTRAQACWYRIVTNDSYGVERPLLEVSS